MDPDATLAELRETIASMRAFQVEDTDHPSYCVVPNREISKVIESFQSLDKWLTSDGFLPKDWETSP